MLIGALLVFYFLSIKLLFKRSTLRSLILWLTALKSNGGGSFFCLKECVRLLNQYLKFPPVSAINCAS